MPEHDAPRRRRAARRGAVLAAIAVTIAGAFFTAHAAADEWGAVPVTGEPGRLVLTAAPTDRRITLSPGDPTYWQVAATLEDADWATLALHLQAAGRLVAHPSGLRITVDACPDTWSNMGGTPRCAAGSERITVTSAREPEMRVDRSFDLRPLHALRPLYLLVTLALDPSSAASADESLMSLDADIAVGLTATAIDGVPTDAPGLSIPEAADPPQVHTLPRTGANAAAVLALGAVAAALVAAGAVLRVLSRRAGRS